MRIKLHEGRRLDTDILTWLDEHPGRSIRYSLDVDVERQDEDASAVKAALKALPTPCTFDELRTAIEGVKQHLKSERASELDAELLAKIVSDPV